ncbi:MAG: GTP pyrophosphokinase family protein [Candidatus Ornithomonoglobus sp.]
MEETVDTRGFYGESQLLYDSVLIEIESRLNIIKKFKTLNNERDPIENVKTRIKSPASMVEKLRSKGLVPIAENIPGNVMDAAGARVICTYVDDVYEVARILSAQKDIIVLEVKDYIKNPKPSGYRSYHMIVELPIYIGEECHRIPAEIQIRTLSMDFWASLEHKIRYKHDIPNQQIIASELRRCADEVASVEMNFITIRDMINATKKENSRIDDGADNNMKEEKQA